MRARWDILLRPGGSDGGGDQTLMSFDHVYTLDADAPYHAILYADSASRAAVGARGGDRLVLRITVEGGDASGLFEPNGDGRYRNGQIPHFTLPH